MMGFMERSAKRRDDGWRLRESRLQMKPSELPFELTTTFDGFSGVIVPMFHRSLGPRLKWRRSSLGSPCARTKSIIDTYKT